MIAADFDLNLGGFFEKLKIAEGAVGNIKLPALSLGVGGVSDAAGAVGNMQESMARAASAAAPLEAILSRIEAGLHGLAAVSRITTTAMAILPGVFAGLPPAVTKTFSAVSLASRGFDVLRGKMSPLGGVMAYLEMRNLGLSKSYAGLTATLGVASSAVMGASRRITNTVAGAGRNALGALSSAMPAVSGMLGPIAAIGGVAGLAAGSIAALGSGLRSAMRVEDLTVSFKVLLGSVTAAKEAVADLTQFAEDSPFEEEAVVSAGRQLLAFGFQAQELKPLLTDLGDTAAAMQKPFDQVADTFGRLKSGQFGEAFQNLRSMGISREDLEGQGLTFDKSGSYKGSVDAAMTAVRAVMQQKFGGTMKELSMTTSSQLLGLQERISAVFREFAAPLNNQLGPMIEQIANYVKSLVPAAQAAGRALANAFLIVQEAFSSGKLGELVGLSLQVGFTKAVNFLMAAFRGLLAMLISGFTTAPGRLIEGLKALFDGNLWTGLGQVLMSIGQGFIAVLSGGLAPIVDKLIAVLNKIPGIEIPFTADDFAGASREEASRNWAEGMARMGGALAPVGQKFAEDFGVALAEFQKAFAASPEFMDEAGPGARLRELLSGLQAAVDVKKLTEENGEGTLADANKALGASTAKLVASSLASLGLGGVLSASATSPALNESRKQTRLQERTMRAVEKLVGGGGQVIRVVPSFG